jgi:hypothetical protein
MSEMSSLLKYVIETVNSGNRIKARCKKEWEVEGPDIGMVCDIIKIDTHENEPDELGEEEILVYLDFMPYLKYNTGFAKPTWYDKLGEPRLIWFETIHWEKNQGKEELYLLKYNFEDNFDVELTPLFKDYLNSEESKKNVSYIKFLEDTVMKLSSKILVYETSEFMDDDNYPIAHLEALKKKPLEGVGYLMESEKIYNKVIDEVIEYLKEVS